MENEETVCIVFGVSANNVTTPVTAANSYKEAVKKLQDRFGISGTEEESVYGLQQRVWSKLDHDDLDREDIKDLFRSYYGGCGHVYKVIARKIPCCKLEEFSYSLD